jgi:tetratricopeptide (TPR) repeat protein
VEDSRKVEDVAEADQPQDKQSMQAVQEVAHVTSEAPEPQEDAISRQQAEMEEMTRRPEEQASPEHAEKSKPTHGLHCLNCGKYDGPLFRCSRCGSVCFCSVDCQRIAWRTHKSDCARMAQAKSPSKPASKSSSSGATPSPVRKAATSPPVSDHQKDERSHRDFGIVAEEQSGSQFFTQGQYREAHAAFSRMRVRAQEMGLLNEEGRALRLIGNALDKLHAPGDEVDDIFKNALKIAHQCDDMELSFNVLTGMASHATKMDDVDIAEHFYLQALTLAQRVLTQDEVATAESNLAMCLARIDSRRSESYSHFRKAISLQQKSMHSKATMHANLASAYCMDGRTQDGIIEYRRALDLAHEIGNHRVEINVLTNLSNLYDDELQDHAEARKCRERLAELRAGGSVNAVSPKAGSPGAKEDAVCAICLEALESQDKPLTILPCTHSFHKSCWENCLENRCPLCMDALSFAAR